MDAMALLLLLYTVISYSVFRGKTGSIASHC
jgi:hypothetical protein